VPAGYLYVDGIVGDVGVGVLRDRQVLANEGVVVVIVTIAAQTREIVNGPEIVTRGWVYAPEAETLLGEAAETVRKYLSEALQGGQYNLEALRQVIRRTTGKFVSERTKRKPMILPVILEV